MSRGDELLAASDLAVVKINLPEWSKEPFWVRTMNGAEAEAWERSIRDGKGDKKLNAYASLAVLCLCDDDKGSRTFRDDQVEAVAAKSIKMLRKVWNAATKLNGLLADDQDELIKN